MAPSPTTRPPSPSETTQTTLDTWTCSLPDSLRPYCRATAARRRRPKTLERYEVLPVRACMAWPHSPLPSFSCVSFRRGSTRAPCFQVVLGSPPCGLVIPVPPALQLCQILKTSQPAPLRHHSACEALLFRHLFTCRCTWSLALRFADGPRASSKSLNSQSPSCPFAPSAVLSSQAHRRRFVLVIVDLPPSHVLCAETNCRPRIPLLLALGFASIARPLLETFAPSTLSYEGVAETLIIRSHQGRSRSGVAPNRGSSSSPASNQLRATQPPGSKPSTVVEPRAFPRMLRQLLSPGPPCSPALHTPTS